MKKVIMILLIGLLPSVNYAQTTTKAIVYCCTSVDSMPESTLDELLKTKNEGGMFSYSNNWIKNFYPINVPASSTVSFRSYSLDGSVKESDIIKILERNQGNNFEVSISHIKQISERKILKKQNGLLDDERPNLLFLKEQNGKIDIVCIVKMSETKELAEWNFYFWHLKEDRVWENPRVICISK